MKEDENAEVGQYQLTKNGVRQKQINREYGMDRAMKES